MSLTILHVTQPVVGGVPRCVAGLVADQLERGWRVAVACPADSQFTGYITDAGADHLLWRAGRSPGPAVPAEVARLRRFVADSNADLVHLHSAKAGLAGRLAIRGKRPTIFQPHAWSFFAARGPVRAAALAWERFAARWASAIVCVSEGERAAGDEAGIRGRWRVIPNGVDLEAFQSLPPEARAAARLRLGLNSPILVLCIGRLARQKGQDVLLEAWPAVERRVEGAELVLVGSGPAEAALRATAGAARLVGERADIRDWLAAADLVVLPSRWEGMSYTVLEAIATGRSVVATDVPGMREALGDLGAIVPPEEADLLADAIVERLREADARSADERLGPERVARLYGLGQTTGAMAELYEELTRRQ